MTRENKLALVVGFGLILFVGILISDHFSIVRNQQVADLTAPASTEALVTKVNKSELIDLMGPPKQKPAMNPAVSTGTLSGSAANSEQAQPEQKTSISEDGLPNPERVVMQPGGEVQLPGFNNVPTEPTAIQVRFHDVRNGETLYSICRQYYGDTDLVNALARHNKMDDPAALRANRRLMIPTAESLGGHSSSSSTPSITVVANGTTPPPKKPAQPKTYTVKEGDSLAQIAQRFLGSKGKWKKLHDMNRDVVEDPDDLKVGTVLRVL